MIRSIRGLVLSLLSASLVLSAAACGGGGGGGGGDGCTAITDTSLTNLQAQIFTPNCALTSCHGSSQQGGQDLRDGATYSNTVNVASTEQPSLMRVKPSDHGNSYLFQKINLPSSATSMPPFQPLCQEKRDAIQAWIDAGAPDN